MSNKQTDKTQEPAQDTLTHYDDETSIARPVIREVIENQYNAWLDYLATEGGASESTIFTYAKGVRRFVEWLVTEPRTLERSTLIVYRNDLKSEYSPATVNLWLVAIRRFLDWLEAEGEIPRNPAIGVKGIKDPDRSRSHKRDELTPSEVKRVISVIDTSTLAGKRDLAIVSALAYGAFRQIEIQRARIGDYQVKRSRRVFVIWGKGDLESDDYIVVNPEFEIALAEWIAVHPGGDDPEGALFCSLHPRTYCRFLTTRHIRRIVKGYYLSAGIRDANKTTLSLRNSAITAVIRAGGSLLQVQRVARHIDPKTTEKYIYDYDRLEDPAEFMIKY
jgi:site-specific recombinase XerD